tara:strand:+ start:1055 stop:1759 length:705 start_codon:yes stop_codon:yes gene_type:complete
MISKQKLNSFEKIIGYKFKNSLLLSQSLTHPSFFKDLSPIDKNNNQFERLEFLGDRVLGLIIAFLIFKNNKSLNEGDLSKKYSYLVQKNFLHKISLKLNIDKFLLYNFNKNNTKMLISIQSDAVESLIGAIFIDGGYEPSYKFIKKFWFPYLNIKISKAHDPKTTLQEISQQKIKKLPEYKLINKKGPSHSPLFTVSLKVLNLNQIKAEGQSIREAERKAANEALKIINEKKIT